MSWVTEFCCTKLIASPASLVDCCVTLAIRTKFMNKCCFERLVYSSSNGKPLLLHYAIFFFLFNEKLYLCYFVLLKRVKPTTSSNQAAPKGH